MPLLGTYLVGTVVFAGEHLVASSIDASGDAQAEVTASALRSGLCSVTGQAAGECEPSQTVGSVISGSGKAEAALSGCVPIGFQIIDSGQAGAVVSPGIVASAQALGKGEGEASARWFPKFQGLGLRVDFIEPADFPEIKFKEVLP